MGVFQRYDSTGKLGKVVRTAQGGVEVPAAMRKVGVLVYTNPDGSERREYVSKEELCKAQSLETLRNAPVTNLHPYGPEGNELVNSENFRDYSVGHLVGEARVDEEKLVGTLVIQDKHTVEQIDRGDRNEVSLGYLCSFEPKPGVAPDGQRYDGVQRNIIYNHVALVPRGRAGRDVALRLDSEGNQMGPDKPKETTTMEETKEVRKDVKAEAKAEKPVVKNDVAERLVTLEAERDQYKAELEGFKAKFDDAVAERVNLVKLAESKGIEAVGSNQEIRSAILEKVSPSLKFDSADEVYVRAALDVALATSNLVETAKRAVSEESTKVRRDADEGLAPDVLARENMVRRLNGRAQIDRFGNPVAK